MSGSQAGYTATNAYDVVGVFDANFNQLFPDARPLKASVKESAKLMQHPVESGATMTDFKIINPIEISLPLVLSPETYVDTYYEIKAVFLSYTTVSVQTNTGFYKSMLISGMPHEENPDHFDTITITLTLKEIQIAISSVSTLAKKDGGNKTGKAASTTETSNATTKTKESSAAYSLLFGKGAD